MSQYPALTLGYASHFGDVSGHPFWSFLCDGICKLFYPTVSGWSGNVVDMIDPLDVGLCTARLGLALGALAWLLGALA